MEATAHCPHCGAAVRVTCEASTGGHPGGGDFDYCDSGSFWTCGVCLAEFNCSVRTWRGDTEAELLGVRAADEGPPLVETVEQLRRSVGERRRLLVYYAREVDTSGEARAVMRLGGEVIPLLNSRGEWVHGSVLLRPNHLERRIVLRATPTLGEGGVLGLVGDNYYGRVAEPE